MAPGLRGASPTLHDGGSPYIPARNRTRGVVRTASAAERTHFLLNPGHDSLIKQADQEKKAKELIVGIFSLCLLQGCCITFPYLFLLLKKEEEKLWGANNLV